MEEHHQPNVTHVPARTFLNRLERFSPMRVIKNHFNSTTYHRSESQLEREKYIIPKYVLFNRWYLVPAATIMCFCAGTVNAWSVYNLPIEQHIYGQPTNTASIAYFVLIGGVGIAAALVGPWLERHGPTKTGIAGACMYIVAHLLASLSIYTKQIWLVFVGYGIIIGAASGIVYVVPLPALQRYFPDKRGLVTGLAVSGFGMGNMAASVMQLYLINGVGLPLTFIVLGCIYFCLIVFASLILRVPPPEFSIDLVTVEGTHQDDIQLPAVDQQCAPPVLTWTTIQALKHRDFLLILAFFFCNELTGSMVISQIANMVENLYGRTKSDGAMVVAVNGVCNLIGRFLFGALSDKVGRKPMCLLSLGISAVVVACMDPVLRHKPDTYWFFVVFLWIISACSGAPYAVMASMLAELYGPSNLGSCHGVIIFIGLGAAAVSGGLAYTAIYKSMINTYGYSIHDALPDLVNFYWLLAVILIGITVTLFIRTNVWHRLLAEIDPSQVFYFSIGEKLLRINFHRGKKRQVNVDEQEPILKLMNMQEIINECDRKGGIAAFERPRKKNMPRRKSGIDQEIQSVV